MKIIQLSFSFIIIIILKTFTLCFKSKISDRNIIKNHKNTIKLKTLSQGYNPSNSPDIIVEYIKENLDLDKDKKKILKTCLNFVSESSKLDRSRHDFWEKLEKLALDNSNEYTVTAKDLKEFIKFADDESIQLEGSKKIIQCGTYIEKCLKSDDILKSEEHIKKVKTFIQSTIGVFTEKIKKRNSQFVSSFASFHRDSNLRSPNLFKKLNAKN